MSDTQELINALHEQGIALIWGGEIVLENEFSVYPWTMVQRWGNA